jgi:hypothetical protein
MSTGSDRIAILEQRRQYEEGGMRSDMIWVVALIIIALVGLIGWGLGILDIGGGHLPLG